MSSPDFLCLRLAIAPLTTSESNHFAIWVLESPFPGGFSHHDCVWDERLSQIWQSWQEFFSLRGLPQVPHVPSAYVPQFVLEDTLNALLPPSQPAANYTSRLMQGLGLTLWQWLFSGPIEQSLERSLGMAMGQSRPLHIRLEIRDPELISLPWEIMQPQSGRPAISLGQQMLFSRSTSAVDPLPDLDPDEDLRILLVLGSDEGSSADGQSDRTPVLRLHEEAQVLKDLLEQGTSGLRRRVVDKVPCQVHTLVEPDPATMIRELETGRYNVFFYAGHGVPAPDGGLLFLRTQAPLNGTELAQVLTRCRIKLAVFNTCWGAQPDQRSQSAIPRSSLAEVLLHHGVPAVLAMRDSIADEEALSFIQAFAQALAERHPVEQAMALARQQLLTLYGFNKTPWTLPVLYMHPQFDGVILEAPRRDVTRLPGEEGQTKKFAAVRSVEDPARVWPIYGGLMHVGRLPDNDLVIPEPWVSGQHAEIFCRNVSVGGQTQATYFLRDRSRFGTYCYVEGIWQHIHQQEVALNLGAQLRFGSHEGRLLEFIIEGGGSRFS
ncbi:CHAT domain-containing protein [Pseudanabaena sp. FACHB-2040]|uniref:CHAT domain-containing protein n=1 Tax=Pseudanabaena sp. FACHB-2040 TaxID=2692859 RepID=UPI0016830BCA|nr:CHAT domain-containing protein [Pseudanabaena sp. FACHB-2040]MBD2258899.1 CHAT domain-containing protein [Pseudanabaena sp. FACHB-2040]